jgi:hypothetical protein
MMMDQAFSEDTGVYHRELPGGGYVKIDVYREEDPARTCVFVERRAKHERRPGHRPVIIAEADGDEWSPAFGDLYRMATDNAAIARKLLEIEGPQRAD